MSMPPTSSHGRPLLDWVSEMGYHLSEISTIASSISVVGWIMAGLYQMYSIYRTKEVEGFSKWFLLSWVIGDLSNVIGSFLTGQMFFQRFLASCFLLLDGGLLAQYFYYTYFFYDKPDVLVADSKQIVDDCQMATTTVTSPKSARSPSPTPDNQAAHSEGSVSSSAGKSSPVSIKKKPVNVSDILIAISASSSVASAAPIPSSEGTINSALSSSTAALVGSLEDSVSIAWVVGTFCGYICSTLYFVSAIPQMIKNYQEKSTGTVSICLFLADLIGNMGYSMSIIATGRDMNDSDERYQFFMNEMPFLVGTSMVFLLELVIMWQFYIYRGNEIRHHHRHGMDEIIDEDTPLLDAVTETAPLKSDYSTTITTYSSLP